MNRVVVADLDGVWLAEVEARELVYSDQLNGDGTISFMLPLRDEKATTTIFAAGERELYVYRGDTRVWGGYLWDARASVREERVRFAGAGWFSRLRRRHLDATKTYTATEQLDIAWGLIDFTQQKSEGNLGITRASVPASGITRDRTYYGYERKNIGEAIQQLAAVENGFDFAIDPDKVWTAYYPRKGVRTAHVFELGKNVEDLAVDYAARELATEVTALGEGEGDTMKISVRADTTALTRYGLLQDAVSFKDVSVQSTLDAHAGEEMRVRKALQNRAANLTVRGNDPPFGSVVVGDEVRIRGAAGYINIDDYKRVTGREVAITQDGVELVTLSWDEVLSA